MVSELDMKDMTGLSKEEWQNGVSGVGVEEEEEEQEQEESEAYGY